MTNDKDKAAETGGAEDVAGQATEGILGPNPFIGLRPQDILGTVGNIGGQAVKQPMLVLEQEAALARDLVSLLTDALSPTNTLLGNPAALKRVIDSGGGSLLEGIKNLLTDLTANQGMPAQVHRSACQLGENLAV